MKYTPYKIETEGHLDSKGEHKILKDIMYEFGAGLFPLLTDRHGEFILTDDVNADFAYKTNYIEEENKTTIYLYGYTMNIPINKELASMMDNDIQKMIAENELNAVGDVCHGDMVLMDNGESIHCELSVIFDFNKLKECTTEEEMKKCIFKDNSKLAILLYEVSKRSEDEQGNIHS